VLLVVEPDDDDEKADEDRPSAVVHEVAIIERGDPSVDTRGCSWPKPKNCCSVSGKLLLGEQVRTCLRRQVVCPQCDRPRAHKDTKTFVMRTLLGTVRLTNPHLRHCSCQPQPTHAFCLLAAALPERATPALMYLESKFTTFVSCGQSARLLAETLPLGRTLHASAVLHTLATGEHLESELVLNSPCSPKAVNAAATRYRDPTYRSPSTWMAATCQQRRRSRARAAQTVKGDDRNSAATLGPNGAWIPNYGERLSRRRGRFERL
jgi:hypothetical protein